MTNTRTASILIGTESGTAITAASIGVGGTAAGALTIGSGNTNASGLIGGEVVIGASPPTSSPTVQFAYTLDGTNYIPDGGPFVVPTATGTYPYTYPVPAEVVGGQVVVTNGTGNAISAWFQGITLGIS